MIRYADPRGFAELAVTTNFSFLRGASHPEELVAQAITLGLDAIGVADRNSLAGVVRAHLFLRHNKEAANGLRVLPGTRLVFCDGTPDILAYPRDRPPGDAFAGCSPRATSAPRRAPAGLTLEDLLAWQEGLQLVALPASTFEPDVEARLAARHFPEFEEPGLSTPSERNEAPDATGVVYRDEERSVGGRRRPPSPVALRSAGEDPLSRLATACPGRLWIGAVMAYGRSPRSDLLRRRKLADRLGVPMLATNDVAMHDPARTPLLDIVTCIRHGVTLEAAGRRLAPNAERHLKPPAEMRRLFAEAPEAVAETLRFAAGLAFSLDELGNDYPEELREGFATPQEALAAFAAEGARRYPLRRHRAAPRHGGHRPRARSRPADGLRPLLPDGARHRALRPLARHPVPGPGIGGELDALLLPRHHRGRSRPCTTCCSSASSRSTAGSRPTSTSTSSTSGARR